MRKINLFDLFAKIALDTSDYEKGLKNAEGSAKSFASKLGSGLKTAGKIGAAAIGAVTVATTAVSTAMIKGIKDTAEYGDIVDKMSQKMGLSAEAYQEWDAIMQHSGISIESLKTGMKTLANAVENGNGAFTRLGITQEQIASLNQEELFSATIAGLQNISDETERTYLAGQLLGRGATELGPLLNKSAEETEEMRKRVHELGGVMSNEAVISAAEFKDNLQDLQTSITGIKRGVTQEFLPGINNVLAGFTSLIIGEEGAEEKLTKGFSSVLNSVSVVIPKIVSAVQTFGSALVKAAPQVLNAGLELTTSIIQGLVNNSDKIVDAGFQIINILVSSFSDPNGLITLIDATYQIIDKIATGLTENLPVLIPSVVGIIINIGKKLTDPQQLNMLINSALSLINALADGLIKALPQLIKAIPQIIDSLTKTLLNTENVEKIIRSALDIILSLADGLIDAIPSLLDAVPIIITALVDNLISNGARLGEAAVELILELSQFLTDPNNLLNLVRIAVDLVLAIGKGIIQALPELAQVAVELVTAFINHILGKINDIKQAGNRIIEYVKNGIHEKIDEAKTWGKDLIQNFLDGITAKWQALRDKVSSVAQTVKNFLGFSEPTEGPLSNFHTFAPDMMALFTQGVSQNESNLKKQIAKTFDFSDLITAPEQIDFTDNIRDNYKQEKVFGESGTERKITELTDLIKVYLPQLLNRQLVLSTGALVGELLPDIDMGLGGLQYNAQRGIA